MSAAGDHPVTGIPITRDTSATLHVGSRIGVHHVTEPLDPYEAQHAQEQAANTPSPAAHPDLLTEIAEIPHSVWAMQREVKALLDLLAVNFTPRPFAPFASLSNALATVLGGTGWAVGVPLALTNHGAVELADVVVGTDAAQTVELRAVPGDTLATGVTTRLLGTLRTTATVLTQQFAAPLILNPGESLILLCTSASAVHFDFSCRYRYLRS